MGLFDNLFSNAKEKNNFTGCSDLVPDHQFWKIIQATFNNSNGDYEEQQREISKEIRELSLQDIMLFDNRFSHLNRQAYNRQLWAAIYIIHRDC